ncbi:MAG: 3-hydroxyacyl-ACP dehydratase FabZ [Kofleriaceae bacterium]|nr:MAG: 3-hydroxyacyl-ACP dehydratase FabZ [Kofleriaceae bacterium]MBZ0235162.1 3-hydroxyacyl-ACP dehydratase FabZ [Kofleriaceae bacterium]
MIDRPPLTAPLAIERIQELLPHRYPFLLVDRVVELSDDKVVAIKNVSINEPFFAGHFPGAPVMPGVLQIEAMAQAGGILAQRVIDFDFQRQVMLFLSIDAAKFRKAVVPGDQLRIEVVPLRKGKIFKMRGECSVDGKVVSEAELLATVAERTKLGA